MTDPASGRGGFDASRNLALLNYGLLFAAIFFAGVPALIAAIIAYSQRDDAPPDIRRHLNSQIRIFWVAFGLTFAAGLCLLGALVGSVGDVVAYTHVNGWGRPGHLEIDMSRLSLDGSVVALLAGFGGLSLLSLGWLVCAPAIGFIRLASQSGIGHSAPP
jgi:uncharacterized membrane protein